MRLVTAAMMRAIDQSAMHGHGISSLTLMENAGRGVAALLERRFGPLAGSRRRVWVACGHGNNGGDGMVVARLLHQSGVTVRALAWAERDAMSPECAINCDALAAAGGALLSGDAAFTALESADASDLFVDALLGTGAHGAPRGATQRAVQALARLAERGARVVSLDIPSGLDADTGAIPGDAVPATCTATLGLGKRGLVLYPGRSYAGLVEVLDIGIPDAAVQAVAREPLPTVMDVAAVRAALPRRAPTAHKGDAGRVVIVGGSRDMSGAVALAARAAVRMGAGTVTMVVPRSVQPIVAGFVPEPMTHGVAETPSGALHLDALAEILAACARASVVAIGPGMGRDLATLLLVRELLAVLEAPVVLDADGLHALAAECDGACPADVLHVRPTGRRGRSLTVTPHVGEIRVLTGVAHEHIEAARFDLPQQLARASDVVVLLKGTPTVVAAPDGRRAVTTTGNPGMATGGAGDALTGALAALIGQGVPSFEAAATAAWLHGAAGDLAVQRRGVLGLNAGDIIEMLPAATLAAWEASA